MWLCDNFLPLQEMQSLGWSVIFKKHDYPGNNCPVPALMALVSVQRLLAGSGTLVFKEENKEFCLFEVEVFCSPPLTPLGLPV